MDTILIVLAVAFVIWNVITFLMYGADKKKAEKKRDAYSGSNPCGSGISNGRHRCVRGYEAFPSQNQQD